MKPRLITEHTRKGVLTMLTVDVEGETLIYSATLNGEKIDAAHAERLYDQTKCEKRSKLRRARLHT